MFENLTVESEERRTNAPALKVEASPEVTAIVAQAWAKQQESGEKSLGHIVGPIGEAEIVDQFHAQARAACNGHEPRLKYRRLARVGKSKDETRAYFAVALWPEGEDTPESAEPDGGTPETPEAAVTEQKTTARRAPRK